MTLFETYMELGALEQRIRYQMGTDDDELRKLLIDVHFWMRKYDHYVDTTLEHNRIIVSAPSLAEGRNIVSKVWATLILRESMEPETRQ